MGAGHTRREFLRLASAGAGATAWAMSAASYGRVLGANDRINIGLIGCGSRGKGAHMPGVRNCKDRQNAAVVAVCDPWRLAREEAAQLAKDWFGVENPQQYVSYRDLLAEAEVDAIMIASCDFQHTTHLTAAAKAGKHVYCEKPLSMDVESLNRAYDAVKEAGVVFQAGTQLRSQSSFVGCREVYRTGVLGTVGRVEQQRNGDRPYWYAYIKDAKEEDVDWAEFLMDRPMRPFDPVQFTGWYGYRDFSDGPVPGLASHYVDLVHYITGAGFPVSAVSHGGTFTWKDEHNFTCPDHQEVAWIYPEGFMAHYSTNFGNGSGNTFKIFGNQGVLDMVDWNSPTLSAEGVREPNGNIPETRPVEPVDHPDHMEDWLMCVRNGGTPNADIEAGYQHAITVLMAMRAFDTGKRHTFDREKRQILEG